MPKFSALFSDMGRALPWNTQLLIAISLAVSSYWWAILIVAGGSIYGFRRWKRSPRGKDAWDRFNDCLKELNSIKAETDKLGPGR